MSSALIRLRMITIIAYGRRPAIVLLLVAVSTPLVDWVLAGIIQSLDASLPQALVEPDEAPHPCTFP